VAVAALALALSATGAGCSAGFDPPVFLVEPDTVEAEVGDLRLRGLVLVKAEGGDSVALVGAVVNGGSAEDTLTKVEIAGQSAPLTLSPNLSVEPGQLLTLGGSEGEPVIVEGAGDLPVGVFAPVTLSFRNAGSAELRLLVEDAEGIYQPYAPPGAPTPAATPAPEEAPTPGATESPTEQPTPTP
jgi:hypothetical protein